MTPTEPAPDGARPAGEHGPPPEAVGAAPEASGGTAPPVAGMGDAASGAGCVGDAATAPGREWRAWAERLPERGWARDLSEPVVRAARRGFPPGAARDAWRGRWLGHALHPMLTDLPIGFWTNASVLDLVGGRSSAAAARKLVGLGVLAAVPTALAGLADLSATDERSRVIGGVHAVANVAGVACYAASYGCRRRHRQGRGMLLAGLGATVATVGGYLGGHLTQVRKLGDLDGAGAGAGVARDHGGPGAPQHHPGPEGTAQTRTTPTRTTPTRTTPTRTSPTRTTRTTRRRDA